MITWAKHSTARILGILCVVVFAALVLDVLWGVLTRKGFGHQAFWTEELARLLLMWLAMLGSALAYIENKHLGIDALTRVLHPSAQRIATVITHLAVLFFAAGVMVYGGAWLFADRWDAGQMMSALPMRKAWYYLPLPVSGFLISLFALDAVIAAFKGRDVEPKSSPDARSA